MNSLFDLYGKNNEVVVDEDIATIIDNYILNLQKQLKNLIDAIDEKDTEKISKLVHIIKGTAGSYGLSLVEKFFNDFSIHYECLDPEKLKQLVVELNKYLDDVLLMNN